MRDHFLCSLMTRFLWQGSMEYSYCFALPVQDDGLQSTFERLQCMLQM